jgi:predicted dehydrogenase
MGMGQTMVEIQKLHGGMVGMGMIFEETYRPFFENAYQHGIHDSRSGIISLDIAAVASRTGKRAAQYKESAGDRINDFTSYVEPGSMQQLLAHDIDFVCVATPDDRHFDAAMAAIAAGKHVLIEKPSVLSLQQLDQIIAAAQSASVICKVVYHKLFDPDHKKLRTLVHDNVLQHVNNGYCTLLEPKEISGAQFAEWIQGRNPGTYVAVHYIKLIDFTFGGKLKSVSCTGQRGLVGEVNGNTWDSVQLQMIYEYESGREAAFDIHTSWVTPDNFPGYVEQEVQFRFDNGVWNGHSRKRGVECTVEEKTPHTMKNSMNNHYNGTFIEPNGRRSQRGYGIEVLEQFAREVAFVKNAADPADQALRLKEIQALNYNDISADRQTVATVQAMEAILEEHAGGNPNCIVNVNDPQGGLVMYSPGASAGKVLYDGQV